MQCLDYSCPNRNSLSGYCRLTACTKHTYTTVNVGHDIILDSIIFPQTIGKITYYSRKELIEWVENQQKMNEDPEYGIGNYC